MDTYSFLRQLADSWGLLALFVFFLAVAIWAFLPSQNEARKEASMIPFKDWENEDRTNADTDDTATDKKRAVKKKGPSDE